MGSASEKHWHGAGPTTAMVYIAMQEDLADTPVRWMEEVTDERYAMIETIAR